MVRLVWRKGQLGLAALGLLPAPNLLGDRHVEWSWVATHLGSGPGQLLDFGSGGSFLGLLAARKAYQVTAIDLQQVRWLYGHPNVRGLRADLFTLEVPPATFDVILNCSTVEHVGLRGRYGVRQDQPDGDLHAMALLRRLLKPRGIMVMTVPVGRDAVYPPLHRVYGAMRLMRLLSGWLIEQEEYWVKDGQNRWVMVDRSTALNRRPVAWCYGLGLFVLRPTV